MFWRTLYLDEFQHIRLEAEPRSPPHGGPACFFRSAMNCRNVTVSCLFGLQSPDPIPKLALKNRPGDQSPARTPPPTSLFLPMRLSNSKEPKPHKQKPNFAAIRRQSPAQARNSHKTAALAHSGGQPKILHPRLSAGRSAVDKSRDPIGSAAAKTPQTVGRAAYRPQAIFCQRTFTKKIFRCGNLTPHSAVSRAFSCPLAASRSGAAAA